MKDLIVVQDSPYRKGYLESIKSKECIFLCTIATTKTAEIPGISAAGATPRLRRYTAQADVEYLFFEKTYTLKEIPRNPLGPPSPVVITKAALNLSKMPCFIIDAGCKVKPKVPAILLRKDGLNCISTGNAFNKEDDLFNLSAALALQFARLGKAVILGESVPGGTTTALSLMSFFGIDAHSKVSSSIKDNAHRLKTELVLTAHKNCKIKKKEARKQPFQVVASIGDSMQLVNAVLTVYLADYVPVMLAGGSQMLAVALLISVLEDYLSKKVCWENISVCTTRWVIEDPTADFKGLSREVNPKLLTLAADIDFSHSGFEGLRRYEEGLVKEGVGAGGIAGAGFIKGYFDKKILLKEIERLFEKMLKNK